MTARTIAKDRAEGKDSGDMTTRNIDKVTRFRPDGEAELEQMVERIQGLEVKDRTEMDLQSDERRWGGKL
jgi:hypothetical protein